MSETRWTAQSVPRYGGRVSDFDDRPGVRLRLAYRPPLDVAGLFEFVAARAIPGVEGVDGRSIRRAMLTPRGPALLRLEPAADADAIDLVADGVGAGEVAALVRAARRSLDLDADPAAIDAALASDPIVGPLVVAAPGRRLPGAFDPWATTVLAVLAQGIALSAARAAAGRLAAAIGEPLDLDDQGVDRLFPPPDRLAGTDLAAIGGLGVPARKLATIARLARAVSDGIVDLDGGGDPARTLSALRAVPGIGPWTSAYVAMRVLRDPDAFPAGDAAVRAAFRRRGLRSDDPSIARAAEAWRPWRGYAVAHLWSAG
jgi:AraC family transcriptional regulator, regulatory protein of adaptative response / DNA-3-methyladenine glycosylase II